MAKWKQSAAPRAKTALAPGNLPVEKMLAYRAGILQGVDKLTNNEGIVRAVLETQGVAIDNLLLLDNAGSNQTALASARRPYWVSIRFDAY